MDFFGYLESKTNKKDNLKHCPFCGAEPKYANWAGGGGVWCPKCGAHIWRNHYKDGDDFILAGDIAAEAWNRRVKDGKL